jgi:hypothetical protein
MSDNITKKISVTFIVFLMAACFILGIGQMIIQQLDDTKIQVKKQIELSARAQSRRMLNATRNQILNEVDKAVKKHGPSILYDHDFIREISFKYVAPLRNAGPTGDAFLIRLRPDEKFLYDGSPDCSKDIFLEKGRYMADELIVQDQAFKLLKKHDINIDANKIEMKHIRKIKNNYYDVYKKLKNKNIIMHNKEEDAARALNQMRFGRDTTEEDQFYWNFDDSTEFLEWVVIPAGQKGFKGNFDGAMGMKNNNNTKWLLQLGIQKDELYDDYKFIDKMFKTIKILIYVVLGIISLLILVSCIYVILTVKNKEYLMFEEDDSEMV